MNSLLKNDELLSCLPGFEKRKKNTLSSGCQYLMGRLILTTSP